MKIDKISDFEHIPYTITPEQMQAVEKVFMTDSYMPGLLLMEHASQAVAKRILANAINKSKEILFVCGPGNNGGDGFATARIAISMGYKCRVWCLSSMAKGDALINLNILKSLYPDTKISIINENTMPTINENTALIVDALFGTGLSRELSGVALKLVQNINASELPVIAIDTPSGIDGRTGKILGNAIVASETITFHRIKTGLLLADAPNYTGHLILADIGLPKSWDNAPGLFWLNEENVKSITPIKKIAAHKGDSGKLLIIAGSRGMAGAAGIAANSAFAAGSGLITIACPNEVIDIVQVLAPCATALGLCEDKETALTDLKNNIKKFDAVAIGPGIGNTVYSKYIVENILKYIETNDIPCVIDADALNILSESQNLYKFTNRQILTPHPGEASRLLGISIQSILSDSQKAAEMLAKKYNVSVILKGACSIIISGEKSGINTSGSPSMAKGGSGDALTGALGSILGQKLRKQKGDPFECAMLACYMLGKAGENATSKISLHGSTALDLIHELSLF